ncbi:M48 family metalloprotease, partial [Methylobacterium trifolii]
IAAGATVLGLRRALSAFEPDPLSIFGRVVSPAEAPGLWRLTEGLAERLGALKPEAVVVGLTGGFFVSAGPAVVEPGGAPLTGRILYLPLPYLALLRGDEVAAIIGHELAHYAGGDTVYSQRFLPIYAGVGRSLDAVAEGHAGSFGLLGPSLRLGVFVMENFHLAVRHWSRTREFAADAAGAGPASVDAAA